jgi:hypothetical protein
MDRLFILHGQDLDPAWTGYRSYMDRIWILCGQPGSGSCMDRMSILHGQDLDPAWTEYRSYMDRIWILYRQPGSGSCMDRIPILRIQFPFHSTRFYQEIIFFLISFTRNLSVNRCEALKAFWGDDVMYLSRLPLMPSVNSLCCPPSLIFNLYRENLSSSITQQRHEVHL